jgi:hypothetical protein
MAASLVVIAVGAVLLFVPSTMWIGLSLLCIGTVIYSMESKNKVPLVVPRQKFQQIVPFMPFYGHPQQRKRAGFSYGLRDQAEEEFENADVRKQMAKRVPHVRNGMFNLPLEIAPELDQLIDLKYTKPVKAKYGSVERDKENKWLPLNEP